MTVLTYKTWRSVSCKAQYLKEQVTEQVTADNYLPVTSTDLIKTVQKIDDPLF